MERFDTAIIGTGPAGISAAITLKIRNKNIILFGESTGSEKIGKAHEINNYPGLPAISGAGLWEKYDAHLKSMEIPIDTNRINMVYTMKDYFSLQTRENKFIEAKSVIIATGVSFGKPYEGETEYLGRGVSYCATCDAPLYKGKTVVVVGQTPQEEAEARFMDEVAGKTYYIPLYEEAPNLPDSIEIIKDTPVAITGSMKAESLVLKEQTINADGIFVLRDSVPPTQLVPGLTMEGNHIMVDRQMRTNLAGCFACGDITGTPYQYIKAAGEGNVAAISAVNYLNSLGNH